MAEPAIVQEQGVCVDAASPSCVSQTFAPRCCAFRVVREESR